ncbi:MAG: circadian clock protein KaiC [Acidobacteria bacterium]|nr:circadian clock protein KaiC [Acidobacteriota bacterium]
MKERRPLINKIPTGIPGFDHIAHGGLPEGRTTLISGTAGSAKTVFAIQFLAEGILRGDGGGVFITLEESPDDIRKNVATFGWDIAQWEREGKWVFVDGTVVPEQDPVITGDYDFGALIARIEHAVRKVNATRVSLDSLSAVFTQFANRRVVRTELFRVAAVLRKLRVTSIITAERTAEYGEIGRFGVEEFVADNVIILRHVLEEEKRRRTIEILKFRGTQHYNGEYAFTIVPNRGIEVIPLAVIKLDQRSTNVRISSGSRELDAMCGGGFYRDSVILVSGATGTGKTLLTTKFMGGGAASGERCLLLAFEESREQLFRNATGWGVDFERLERDGLLRVVCQYPEISNLEDHLIRIKAQINDFRPNRVAVDSLSALERGTTTRGFREFVIALTSFIKDHELAGLFTSTTPTLMGGTSVTEAHISTITDSIILLRYVEMFGEMRRGITVLKMRGSMHDKSIREFRIDATGMHIGKMFREVSGILSGMPTHTPASEIDRVEQLFTRDASAGG